MPFLKSCAIVSQILHHRAFWMLCPMYHNFQVRCLSIWSTRIQIICMHHYCPGMDRQFRIGWRPRLVVRSMCQNLNHRPYYINLPHKIWLLCNPQNFAGLSYGQYSPWGISRQKKLESCSMCSRTVTRNVDIFKQTGDVIPRQCHYGPYSLLGPNSYKQIVLFRFVL